MWKWTQVSKYDCCTVTRVINNISCYQQACTTSDTWLLFVVYLTMWCSHTTHKPFPLCEGCPTNSKLRLQSVLNDLLKTSFTGLQNATSSLTQYTKLYCILSVTTDANSTSSSPKCPICLWWPLYAALLLIRILIDMEGQQLTLDNRHGQTQLEV